MRLLGCSKRLNSWCVFIILCTLRSDFHYVTVQYKSRHLEMHGAGSAASTAGPRSGATRKLTTLLRELSDDEDDMQTQSQGSAGDSESIYGTDVWLEDWNGYMQSKDRLGGMTIVQWWGVCCSFIELDFARCAHIRLALGQCSTLPGMGLTRA